ncbi:MAG: glycosyltransferase [Nitrospirota bacterium]
MSVIIPTLNASSTIGKLLSVLLDQDIDKQIIVVDSSSEDGTVEIVRKFGVEVIVIPRKAFDHGGTRNMASLKAKGDILVFMTQDALPVGKTSLRKLITPLVDPVIAATFGRHIPRNDASPLETFARQFNYPEEGCVKGAREIERFGIKTFFLSNVFSSFRRGPFLKVGMFPEGVRANEDMLMTAKLIIDGFKVAYVPEAMVIHSHRSSLLWQFKRYFNIGSSLKNCRWILDYARHPEAEGMRMVKEQMRFVIKQHQYKWIPYILLESLAKYLGFRIGIFAG